MDTQILPANEVSEVESRFYVNPQAALDESNDFITNLRNTQQANTQQITADTQALGTDVPTNLGGLTGAEGYFTSRYQTPQTASAVANLRATAQAAALNQVLENEQAIWKKRYQDAYRKYQKSAYNRANSGGGGNDGNGGNDSAGKGDVEKESTDLIGKGYLSLTDEDISSGGAYVVEPGTGNIIRVDENLSVNDPNYNQTWVKQSDGTYVLKNTNKSKTLGTGGTLQINSPLSSALRSNF